VQVIYERCAAVDVGKDVIAVAVRTPGKERDGRKTEKRVYRAFYGVLREMAKWLVSQGVTHVAMEATGTYSMPVYYALMESDFEKVLVCNAGHVKNVPGRKTGLADAEWMAQLLECGLLAGSFIPPPDVKAVRDLVRYRAKIARQRVSEIARLGGVLQDAGIKIDSVASSIATKSGRAMIEALIDGERRGAVLADLAIGRMRSKIPDLSMALEGRFGEHHAMMCRLHMDHIAYLEKTAAELDARIEAMMAPFRAARGLLITIPGIGAVAAAAVICEIGPDPGSTSRPPLTWRPGPACAPATTSRPGNATTGSEGTETSTCSPSWSRSPGTRSATTATSSPSTTGTSPATAATAPPRPRTRQLPPSPTRSS
jgi:transposase